MRTNIKRNVTMKARPLTHIGVLFLGWILATNTHVVRAADHVTPQAAFDSLKKLAGDWEGKAGHGADASEARVTYKVTAHGTTVMEVLFPGTPHEMISMYHLDGGKLVLTHYCAMGNQPKMMLDAKSTANELHFAFAGGSNMDPKKDAHMHAGVIRLVDADSMEAVWEVQKDGKKAGENRFSLKRKK